MRRCPTATPVHPLDTRQHCNFSVREEYRSPNQKSAAKALAPHADSLCVVQRGVWETNPPLGRFQGRSGVVLTRNSRRLARAPIRRFLHTIICKSMYTPTPSPHCVSTIAVRLLRISQINTTNMCALIKLKLPLIFVLHTRDVNV